jgi:hypothetical protein
MRFRVFTTEKDTAASYRNCNPPSPRFTAAQARA